jgi:hypothetical protein
MYSNIPTQDVINIIIYVANREEMHRDTIKEMELMTKLIVNQNCFEQNSIFYKKIRRTRDGCPIFCTIIRNISTVP